MGLGMSGLRKQLDMGKQRIQTHLTLATKPVLLRLQDLVTAAPLQES